MDGFDGTVIWARQQALLGSMSGEGADVIATLKRKDLNIAEALANVFFTA
jgi:hypothetical protein